VEGLRASSRPSDQTQLKQNTEADTFESIEAIKEARIFNLRMFHSGASTFRDFEVLEVDAFQDGALDQKSKEPIALGISICHGRYGCVEYHVSRASGLGASRREIREATAVALALGGGVVKWL